MIQKALEDPLAERILSGLVKDGSTVTVTAGEEGIIMGDAVVAPTPPPPETPKEGDEGLTVH